MYIREWTTFVRGAVRGTGDDSGRCWKARRRGGRMLYNTTDKSPIVPSQPQCSPIKARLPCSFPALLLRGKINKFIATERRLGYLSVIHKKIVGKLKQVTEGIFDGSSVTLNSGHQEVNFWYDDVDKCAPVVLLFDQGLNVRRPWCGC